MADSGRTNMFSGSKTVQNSLPTEVSTNSNVQKSTSEPMSSITATNNMTALTQSPQSSSSEVKSGSTSPLTSLANATEPNGSTTNQQPSIVRTFPQRICGGSPTANTGAPFNFSFGANSTPGPSGSSMFAPNSTSGSSPAFSFTQASASAARTHISAPNPAVNNPSSFSVGNPPLANNNDRLPLTNPTPQNAPHRVLLESQPLKDTSPSEVNHPTVNPQIAQPISTLTFTSSTEKPLSSDNMTASLNVEENLRQMVLSKQSSDPLTPISQQPSFPNQGLESPAASSRLDEQHKLSKKLNTKLQDSQSMVVDRSDKDSPLFSLKSFQQLNLIPELLDGIYQMGFQTPSKIQEIALPLLLNNPPRNIIAQSQSGTGKTATFSLAVLSRIDPSIRTTQALIISPTFELALQIGSVIEKMAEHLSYIQIAYAVRESAGSSRISFVQNQLITHPIVIGTPGTIEDWCRKKRVIDLKRLTMFIVDEADVMIAMGNFQRTCVDLVKDLDHSHCQLMLFSATYSDPVMDFAREIVPHPVVLRLKREKQTLNNIRQFFIRCSDLETKYRAIEQIYAQLTVGQTMIFCRTKKTAFDLSTRMSQDNHAVRLLSSDLDINQRASVIEQFRQGLFRVLVSTNVTARGIDIDDVSLVINYDMPVTMECAPDYETYLHRIGRCGRFGKLGYAFNLIGSEKEFNTMNAIQDNFSRGIEEITIEQIGGLEQHPE